MYIYICLSIQKYMAKKRITSIYFVIFQDPPITGILESPKQPTNRGILTFQTSSKPRHDKWEKTLGTPNARDLTWQGLFVDNTSCLG